ncbi:immunoglobulin-like domain-containing protein [Sporosarcina sp. 179-K 3D1 HS]|uniref:immunoglobulin-like domain-containing protein n=1 Tax=Sporosarcina sp. 179-K 3D1 HS TaxID=3232169 RepID=UPI0039A13599
MKPAWILSLVLLLGACGNTATLPTLPDPVPDQEMNAFEEGLTLVLAEDHFVESPTVIHTVVRNDSQRDVQLGEFYHIEVNRKGEWFIITYSDAIFLKNPHFRDFGNVLPAGSEAQQTFSVEALGIILIPGEYRLVKTFLSKSEPMHELSVAAPFWVE